MSEPLSREKVLELILEVCDDAIAADFPQFLQKLRDTDAALRAELEARVTDVLNADTLVDSLTAENERLKAEAGYYDAKDVIAALTAQRDAFHAQVTALEQELVKWQRIRKPTHGNCCTCQRCGLDHDSCRCGLDEVADELEQAKQQLAAMTQERDALMENLDLCKGNELAAEVDVLKQQLAAMTQERNDLQARVKELEKVFEYRRAP